MDIHPDLREEIGKGQNLAIQNRLRMFRNYSRQIANFMRLERYQEAELLSARWTGILRAWSLMKELKQSYAEKKAEK